MPVKLIFLIQRASGLSRAEFGERYLAEHAPLMLEHCPALRRYVVNLNEADEDEAWPEHFDAAAELWFESVEEFTDGERLYDSPEGAEAVERGGAALMGSVAGYRVAETIQCDYERTWQLGERSPGRKMLSPLRRLEGLTHEQFVEHWKGEHARLALKHVLGIGRYVNNVVVAPLTPGAPDFDGIVEVHYLEKRRFDSPEGEEIMAADVAKFLSPPPRNFVGEYVLRE